MALMYVPADTPPSTGSGLDIHRQIKSALDASAALATTVGLPSPRSMATNRSVATGSSPTMSIRSSEGRTQRMARTCSRPVRRFRRPPTAVRRPVRARLWPGRRQPRTTGRQRGAIECCDRGAAVAEEHVQLREIQPALRSTADMVNCWPLPSAILRGGVNNGPSATVFRSSATTSSNGVSR